MWNDIIWGMTHPSAFAHPDFYIYVMFRENGTPFYIGKGKGPRMARHDGHAIRGRPGHHYNIIRAMLARGTEVPKVKLHEGLTEAEAFEYERALIAAIGRVDIQTGPLANKTEGGEGPSGAIRSEDTRKRMSAALKGHKHSPETLAKIVAARVGWRHTAEARAKMSETRAGKKRSPEVRAKMGGWKQTPEARAKIAASNARRTISAETRVKMGAANVGRKLTPETLAKLIAVNTGRKQTHEAKEKIAASKRGVSLSEKHKEKIRVARLGHKQSPETCAKRRATWAAKLQRGG